MHATWYGLEGGSGIWYRPLERGDETHGTEDEAVSICQSMRYSLGTSRPRLHVTRNFIQDGMT